MSTPETAVKIAESLAKLRLAHEAVMTEDAQQVLKQDRETVRNHRSQLGASPAGGEESSMIHIGDVNHPPAAVPSKSGMGTLAKLAIAGLAATGIGLPVGVGLALPAILDYLKPAPPTAVVPDEKPPAPPVAVDTDSWLEFRLEK